MSETNAVKDESGVAQRSELQPVVMCKIVEALEIAKNFCNTFTAEECPDTVALPIYEALQLARKHSGRCYFADDGTLLNSDGTRSIFDDVDT